MLVAASNPLITVIPGLMIWTIVFFLIAFFVLKKFAFGPIQRLHRRAPAARSGARSRRPTRRATRRSELLEEHRKLIAEARSQGEAILAEARKTRESMEQRMREETEAERQRRLEETRKEIAAETARALQQIRAEVADLTLEAASRVVGRTLDADRDRELIAEAIARPRLLAPGGVGHSRRAPHLRRGAVRRGEGRGPARAGARGARRLRGGGRAESPELRAVLRNPQLEPSAEGAILADLAGDEEPLFTHFLQVVAEKGRAGELEEIAKEFERLMAREERRLTVELTTARELSDAEAEAIVKQIEKAAGRKVEATQKVDPDLVGGIVLQAGSLSRRRERARTTGTTETTNS